MKRMAKKSDMVLLACIFLVLLACVVLFQFFWRQAGGRVTVTVDGEVYGTYSLDDDRTVEIKADGKVTNVLEIHSGSTDIVSADCPDKLCVRQRAVSRRRETIVCLPNKVVVEVMGAKEAELDAVT